MPPRASCLGRPVSILRLTSVPLSVPAAILAASNSLAHADKPRLVLVAQEPLHATPVALCLGLGFVGAHFGVVPSDPPAVLTPLLTHTTGNSLALGHGCKQAGAATARRQGGQATPAPPRRQNPFVGVVSPQPSANQYPAPPAHSGAVRNSAVKPSAIVSNRRGSFSVGKCGTRTPRRASERRRSMPAFECGSAKETPASCLNAGNVPDQVLTCKDSLGRIIQADFRVRTVLISKSTQPPTLAAHSSDGVCSPLRTR